jgi:hypothetical protein
MVGKRSAFYDFALYWKNFVLVAESTETKYFSNKHAGRHSSRAISYRHSIGWFEAPGGLIVPIFSCTALRAASVNCRANEEMFAKMIWRGVKLLRC